MATNRFLPCSRRNRPSSIDSVRTAVGLLTALLAFTLTVPSFAQNAQTGVVRGRVLNLGNNRYLNNAQVTVEGTNLQTRTNEYGEYLLGGVPAGEATIKVVYTGLDADTQVATVTAGETTTLDFKLTSRSRYGDSDTVVLDAFVVQSAREFEGAALATNEQRYSPNIKVVMAADAFGDVAEGNAGEFLKYLPGVTVDYVAADVRTVSVRGFASQFTNVYLDGMRTTSSVSGNTSRTFEFEQVSINNASRVEVTKVPTPDLPADALGGSVNLVSKNAFERPTAEFNYRFYINANSEDTGLFSDTPGPRPGKSHKVKPGFDFDYSIPLSDRFGVVITALNSNQFNEQHRWQTQYNHAQGGANAYNPFLERWQLQDGPKNSHRSSFSIKGDYKIDDDSSFSVMIQDSYYKSFFGNRNINFRTSTSASALEFGEDFVQSNSGASVTMGSSHRDKLGNTFAGLAKYRFNNADWTIDAGINAAKSRTWYRELARGHFSSVNLDLQGESMLRADNITPTSFDFAVMDSDGNAINPYILDNYRINSVRDGPVDGKATMVGAFVDVERHLDNLSFPLSIKVGIASRKEEKDNRRYRNDYYFVGADGVRLTADDAAAPFLDEVYTGTAPGWGFPTIEWADAYKLGELYEEHPEYFELRESNAETFRIQNSQLISERVDAAYVQGTARLMENKLTIVTGLRYEHTKDDGAGPLTANGTLTERAYKASNSYGDVYPSVHLSYDFNDRLVGRFSYAKTLGRPDYANIVPTANVNDEDPSADPTISVSNTGLKPWQGDAFDVSLEYYHAKGGVLSGGAFVKNLSDFWTPVSEPLTADLAGQLGLSDDYLGYIVSSTINGGDAQIAGVEFNVYQNLGFIGGFGDRFSVTANATKLYLSGDNSPDFRGFIPETGNFSIAYNARPIGARITWNYRGRQWIGPQNGSQYGGSAAGFDEYYAPRTFVDLNLDYTISKRAKIFLNARNIFNKQQVRRRYNGATPQYAWGYRYEEFGVQLTLGIKGTW